MNSKASLSSKVKEQSIFTSILLGKNRPDIFTLLSFQLAIVCYITLCLWSLASWFAFTFGWNVQVEKGVQVLQLIEERAAYFGFNRTEFQSKIAQFHLLSLAAWLISFISTFFLYRKKSFFIFLMLGGHGLYLISVNFILGFDFYLNDIGWYEKLAMLITHISGWICWFIHRNEKKGKSTIANLSIDDE